MHKSSGIIGTSSSEISNAVAFYEDKAEDQEFNIVKEAYTWLWVMELQPDWKRCYIS
jgi:hypothetical protein